MNQEKNKLILVVNSEPDIADLFAEMILIDENPYIVTTTFTGKGCLCGIEKNKPDLILTDIELSDMNGWDLIKQIKKNYPEMPIVVISSKIPSINDIFQLSHVSDYLIKPVTVDCLHMAIQDALEIPLLLEECAKTVKGYGEKEDMTYVLYMLLKQSIADRKRFTLMRQLYPDRKLENDPESKKLLDNLKEKINTAQNKIKDFTKNRFLLA